MLTKLSRHERCLSVPGLDSLEGFANRAMFVVEHAIQLDRHNQHMSYLGPAISTAQCGPRGLLSETGLTLSRLDLLTSVDEDQLRETQIR